MRCVFAAFASNPRRIEDMIAITEDGFYDFTQSPKDLIEIV